MIKKQQACEDSIIVDHNELCEFLGIKEDSPIESVEVFFDNIATTIAKKPQWRILFRIQGDA